MTVPEYLAAIRDQREKIRDLCVLVVKEQQASSDECKNLAKIELAKAEIALAEAEIVLLKSKS